MSDLVRFGNLRLRSSALLAAQFSTFINDERSDPPASIKAMLDDFSFLEIPTTDDDEDQIPTRVLLQSASLYLDMATEGVADARDVYAAAKAGFTGLAIPPEIMGPYLGREACIYSESCGHQIQDSTEAITRAIYDTLAVVDPDAAQSLQ
ncbi:hypothetical protein [Galactobacter valiniphilus]|uniref:hypothetical protein n=1 Tax=Galactobacter valiniphilus TaxID=2676122 RepID=UPI003736CC80